MSLELLGEGFDLHCGGMDLKFPHHENERAQAVALGKRFANHWMHHNFVVDAENEKMSKSIGNVSNMLDLVEHYDPRAYRMVLLQGHYRSPIQVNLDNIIAAEKSLARLDTAARGGAALPADSPNATILAAFRDFMDDDLNTPLATALIFETVTRLNTALAEKSADPAALWASLLEMCSAVGLDLKSAGDEIPADALAQAAALDAARATKDFAGADILRKALQEAGYVVETTKDGTRLRQA
jgi:cysteinyl-tRNA synthetase